MKKLSAVIFLLHIFRCCPFPSSIINRITSDLLHEFSIQQCIIVSKEKTISESEWFLIENIPVSNLDYEELIEFVNRTDFVNCRVGIIFHEKNLLELERITEIFRSSLIEREYYVASETFKLCNFIWIIFLDNDGPIHDKNLKIPYQCEFYLITRFNSTSYKIHEVYSAKDNPFLNFLGIWDNGWKLINNSMYHRRLNLNGTQINTVVALTDLDCKDLALIDLCLIEEIIDEFAKMMRFLNQRKSDFVNYIKLFKAEGDIMSIPIALSYLTSLQNFVGPLFTQITQWYIKKPGTQLRPDFYLQPFHIYIWLATISGIITGTVLFIFIHLTPPLEKNKRSFTDNLFVGFEVLCNQNGNEEMNAISSRIVYIALNIPAIVILAAFSAVITSYLAVETIDPPFKNLKEFMENGRYKLQIHEPGAVWYWLNFSTDPMIQHFNQHYTIKLEVEEHRMRRNEVCYKNIALDTNNYLLLDFGIPCALFQIPQPLLTNFIGFNLRIYSEFMKVFNHNVIRLYEYGIQKRMLKRKTKLKMADVDNEFRPIEITQMKQVLFMPFIGLSLAVVFLIVEFIFKNMKKRNVRKGSF